MLVLGFEWGEALFKSGVAFKQIQYTYQDIIWQVKIHGKVEVCVFAKKGGHQMKNYTT